MFYHYFFTADNVNAIRKIIQSCRIHFTFDFNTFRIEYIRLYVFIVRFYCSFLFFPPRLSRHQVQELSKLPAMQFYLW